MRVQSALITSAPCPVPSTGVSLALSCRWHGNGRDGHESVGLEQAASFGSESKANADVVSPKVSWAGKANANTVSLQNWLLCDCIPLRSFAIQPWSAVSLLETGSNKSIMINPNPNAFCNYLSMFSVNHPLAILKCLGSSPLTDQKQYSWPVCDSDSQSGHTVRLQTALRQPMGDVMNAPSANYHTVYGLEGEEK